MRSRSLVRLIGPVVLAAAGACRPTPPPNPLDLVPYEATAVAELAMVRVRGTWLETLGRALARRLDVPGCVVDRAVAADRVIVAYSAQLPADGWLVVTVGGRPGAPCPALADAPGGQAWHRDLAPRDPRDDSFFTDPEHRVRWRRVPAAPLRVVGDYTISAGVTAQVHGTLAADDGVDAHLVVRLATGPAAEGVRGRLDRWRAGADPARFGGAWPALAAVTVRGPATGTPTLELDLALPGAAGGAAASLLATALLSASLLEEPLPCPDPAALARWGATCARGELVVPAAARDRLLAAGPGAATLPTPPTDGSRPLARVRGLPRDGALVAVGLRDGDWVKELDGAPVFADAAGLAELTAHLAALPIGAIATVRIVRAGRQLTLRLRITA
ncbi:MAG: hypothetical protein R3B06_09150 [Kofleriaceae bacterium]